jgi:hypothetical protein
MRTFGGGRRAFVQISDSHVAFDKPANPDALATLREAVAKILALPVKGAILVRGRPCLAALSNEKPRHGGRARP